MMKKSLLITIFISLSLYGCGTQNSDSNTNKETKKEILIGNSQAPIKIIEFVDYNCHYCGKFNNDIYPKISKKYIEKDKANLRIINVGSMRESSKYAALAGYEIYLRNTDEFLRFHDDIYKKYKNSPLMIDLSNEEIDKEIDKLKLSNDNKEDIKLNYKNRKSINYINNNKKIAKKYKVTSIPMIIVNEKKIEDPYDIDNIDAVIKNTN